MAFLQAQPKACDSNNPLLVSSRTLGSKGLFSHLPPSCPVAPGALAVKVLRTGVYTPLLAVVQLMAQLGMGSVNLECPRELPNLDMAGRVAEPSSHASRFIPRDSL